MLVLIWATLLVANAVVSPGEKERCENGLCITTEITAEAGLCVVIPCYFAADPGYTLESAAWYKCDPSKPNCTDSDMIFHLNNTNTKGRVSLLDSKNCSIIINDLKKSDNGSYLVRVNGILNGTTEGYTSPKATITVKDLTQKPRVMIPPLTEGQQTTLTCTAPGLCSGSEPEITWMWRGAGEKDSHITGNITAFKTEYLTAVTRRYSSMLTFNASAEHHDTEVTCKVSLTNGITTEETVTLNVTPYLKILNSSKCEVQSGVLTCVCISEGFPLPTIRWPLLENHAEYSVITTVSDHTVNSTIILTVKDHSSTVVQCVSSGEVWEMQQNITIITSKRREDQGGSSAVLPWVIVAVVSLIVNIICIILLMLLWSTRKKVKPNQEDRTYMSLQKPDPLPEYDVIAQRLN